MNPLRSLHLFASPSCTDSIFLVSVDNICLHQLMIQLELTAAVKTVHHDVRSAMDQLTISVPAVCKA